MIQNNEQGENYKVVIADDKDIFLEQLKTHLESGNDFSVVGIAKDGFEALKMIDRYRPDMVVLDIIMPRLDGLGVLENLRERGDMTPVVVLSAVDNDNIANQALSLGAAHYMLKPFDVRVLKERLLRFVTEKKYSVMPFSEKKQLQEERSVDAQIVETLDKMGIPAHIKGFQFLRESIAMVYNDSNYLNRVTKNLYPAVAKRFETTSSRVERAIRNAIEIGVERGNGPYLKEYFGLKTLKRKDKPTNSLFIATVAEKIRIKHFEKSED